MLNNAPEFLANWVANTLILFSLVAVCVFAFAAIMRTRHGRNFVRLIGIRLFNRYDWHR